MKQDHRPWKSNDFKGGANTDADGVVIAGADGVYRDARNMRLVDNQGNNGTLTKIGGEQAYYVANVPGPETYTCIGCILVKNRVIEFWASSDPDTHMPFMRVNGEVMVQSADLPYKFYKPLQLHKMEDCEGGMVFDARSGDVPLHWDIGDIMAEYAAGNQTYFSGLSIAAYQVNLLRPVNRPVFMGITDIGAGSGMYPGQYGYTTRLVNANGDHTPDGPPLESVMIPVLDDYAPNLPSAGVLGATALQLAQRTKWGAKLKFRVNNKANMAWVEVVRSQYILDGGIDQLVDIVIAARFPLGPGQNEVMYFTDNGDHVGEISTDASLILTHYINSANSVRYIDYRLVYGGVELGKKTVNGVYDGTTKTFPVTRKLGIKGHSDPVNNCYKRRFQSGERYAVGNVFYLPDGSTSDVDFIEEVQLPNRRDLKTGDSLTWSDAPCYAATTDVQGATKVGPTFEVFDHDNATAKHGIPDGVADSWVNIMRDGARLSGPQDSGYSDIVEDYSSVISGAVYHTPGGPHGLVKTSYGLPLRPTTPTDWHSGLDYKVNTGVRNGSDGPDIAYDPNIFNVENHSLAIAINGVNRPIGVQGFSLVSSKPAGRVVTQGLACWKMRSGSSTSNTMAYKDRFIVDVILPDYVGGMLNQVDVDSIIEGSAIGNYQIQFVSPLGIASEVYGAAMIWHGPEDKPYSHIADMISYARVLWDKGQINPGDPSGITEPQLNGSDNFVGFGMWRNSSTSGTPWAAATNGSVIMNVLYGQNMGEGRVRLTLDDTLYGTEYGGTDNFNDSSTKEFHEPWYVVNIVRDGLHPDRLGGYVSCNHYQAYTSEIGITATQNQQFLLADENLDMVQGRVNDGIERYIYLQTQTGTLRYMNMEGMSTAQYTQALLAQAQQGYFNSPFTGEQVEGLFSVGQNGDDTFIKMESFVLFGAIVEVRYDKRIPVVFYGDRVTAPSVAPIIDGNGDANIASAWEVEDLGGGVGMFIDQDPSGIGGSTAIDLHGQCLPTGGLCVPFSNYVYNSKYMVPLGARNGAGEIETSGAHAFVSPLTNGVIRSIRQWIALFDCEVLSPLHLSQYEYGSIASFPKINYRPAPFIFDASIGYTINQSGGDNGLHQNYNDQGMYGPNKRPLGYGGFVFNQLPVSPYRIQPRVRYYERPPNLGDEITNLCDALIYSEKYSPLIRNLPGLKTFPQDNIYFIENDTGAIQRLYSDLGDLYVLTETGVYLALIHKNLMYSPDGSSQNIYATLDFIGSVTPRSKAIGMPGDWWRTAAEGPILSDQGQRTDSLMWFDGTSQYRLTSGSVIDIAKGRYRKGLSNAAFVPSTWTFPVRKCGVYDQDKDELYTGLFGGTPLYAFSPQTNQWYGTTDHQYDNMLWTPKGMMGMRDGITYALDNGQILNGKPVQGWVKVASAPYPNERMWFRRIKVDSVRKPTRIEFYDENDVLVAWMDEATFGPHYLLKETAWEHWIPMDRVSIAPKKKAIQGRLAYAKMMFQDPGEDKVAFSGMLVVPVK